MNVHENFMLVYFMVPSHWSQGCMSARVARGEWYITLLGQFIYFFIRCYQQLFVMAILERVIKFQYSMYFSVKLSDELDDCCTRSIECLTNLP
jgi:hypothetical protein